MRCCGLEMKHYDYVKRVKKSKDGEKSFIFIERVYCTVCKKTKRLLPDELLPFKHYEKEVIEGVQEYLIDSTTLGYEDYPCEMTMKRWRSR